MTYRLPVPNGRNVRELHEKLVREWLPRYYIDEEFRALVHQTNNIELLPDSDRRNMDPIEIHSGRAGGIIDHALGLLMALPSFHAQPPSLTTSDARAAEDVERFLAATFEHQLLANDFWPSAAREVLIYGRAFIKAMPMPTVWTIQEGYPVREKKESAKKYFARIKEWKADEANFPFVIRHVPTLDILPMLDANDNVLATIEEKWVIAKILAEEMDSSTVKELLDRGTVKWYDELPVVEYIDGEHVAYFLAGTQPREKMNREETIYEHVAQYERLRTWRHGLGKCPVVMIVGVRTEIPEYELRYKGFLHDAKDALETYDFLLSRLATMVYAYYLPSYTWKIAATSAHFQGRERPEMKVELGGVTVTYSDEILDVLPFPQNLPDAGDLLAQVDDVIQRHTLEDVLFGRVAGTAPAFQVQLRINVAKSKMVPIAQHMANGLTEIFRLLLRGVQTVGEKVEVQEESITLKQAKKYQDRITVRLEPKSPIDKNQDIGSASMALEFGLPWDWIAENILGIEDPATLRLQKDILEIEQLPQVKERLMADALEQLDALIQEEEFEDAENINLEEFPPSFAEALASLGGPEVEGADTSGIPPELLAMIEGGNQPITEESGQPASPEDLAAMLAGAAEDAPDGGLGKGPFPPGAAPQTLAPRGLETPNTQPAPGTPMIDSEQAGVMPQEGPV